MERTLFLLYYVGGFRAATFCLGSDRRGHRRLVRLGHISFFRNDGRLHAFIVMPETNVSLSDNQGRLACHGGRNMQL